MLSKIFSPPKHQAPSKVANTNQKKKREKERTAKQRTSEESKQTQKITAKQRTSGFFQFPYHLFSKKANKEKKLTNPENPFAFHVFSPPKHQAPSKVANTKPTKKRERERERERTAK